ncbi:hypothetical protein I79_013230 [Cricetulus griseus]|uniref:Uncharacterized protein n=1 Tax=Cricetulus griseus TaxID=10029 RepID=G3HQX1_CRIGR|nr:hypothetical protein I79_013230 [Cricetulus griseus]
MDATAGFLLESFRSLLMTGRGFAITKMFLLQQFRHSKLCVLLQVMFFLTSAPPSVKCGKQCILSKAVKNTDAWVHQKI